MAPEGARHAPPHAGCTLGRGGASGGVCVPSPGCTPGVSPLGFPLELHRAITALAAALAGARPLAGTCREVSGGQRGHLCAQSSRRQPERGAREAHAHNAPLTCTLTLRMYTHSHTRTHIWGLSLCGASPLLSNPGARPVLGGYTPASAPAVLQELVGDIVPSAPVT